LALASSSWSSSTVIPSCRAISSSESVVAMSHATDDLRIHEGAGRGGGSQAVTKDCRFAIGAGASGVSGIAVEVGHRSLALAGQSDRRRPPD
jgi:hypothetical protein